LLHHGRIVMQPAVVESSCLGRGQCAAAGCRNWSRSRDRSNRCGSRYTGLGIGVARVDTAACRFPLGVPSKRTLLAGVEVNGTLHISEYLT
jgi:hypothetical protein